MTSPVLIRASALCVALMLSMVAGWLFIDFSAPGGLNWLDLLRAVLIVISSFWLCWGSAAGLLGLFVSRRTIAAPSATPLGMTAILVPIYNEDPVATFSRVAAMNRSIADLGFSDWFHFAILSDTTNLEIAAQEAVWFEHLLRESRAIGRIFYRRRSQNIGKKAGNVEDFIIHSGAAYDYALILDADSLMEGSTMVEMARRMQADPHLGLLQTLPKIINARSFFGRSMQFSSAYLSPAFARGSALMQGSEGPFWGHNAIVRITAFAANCGLPILSGKPPFGGHILSHDYVEAALLARAGWKVLLDPTLTGSFEEGPENLIEYAKRDRRWCQGNLQHRRLIGAPGLRWWNRFAFVQGIMAYMASPLWLLLLAASIGAAAMPNRTPWIMPSEQAENAVWSLVIGVTVLLILPKFLIFWRGVFDGENRKFGGTLRAIASVIAEVVFSTLSAPIMLMLQSRSVGQVLLGLDGGWPATKREQNHITLADAFAHSWWIMLFGLGTLLAAAVFAPSIMLWILPAMLPMVAAPLLIGAGSRTARHGRRTILFDTPTEQAPAPVMLERERILARWRAETLEPHYVVDVVGSPIAVEA
ncbi:glucans biosynthesis glucosyltransferase MdoH [Devosia sp.]|uniref:glucans biosynthesis glucosyltransferase MdoH n=1 Tax=Devosia sp. TaxID=1871048 RepID=UPI0032672724